MYLWTDKNAFILAEHLATLAIPGQKDSSDKTLFWKASRNQEQEVTTGDIQIILGFVWGWEEA